MNDGTLWGEALVGADYEKISNLAVEVPNVLGEASIGKRDGVTRSAGLLLTKEQIINLRKYVAIAFTFPDTLPKVVDFLRYGVGEDGGTGLTPSNFLSTFQVIRKHADTWAHLRERIKITGEDLKGFGTSMRVFGRGMERFYDSDQATQLIKKYNIKTYEDLKTLQHGWEGVFPGIELEPDTVGGLKGYLDDIKKEILLHQTSTDQIKLDLDTFGDELEKKIIPEIDRRLEFINNNKYTSEITALNKKITDRAEVIKSLNLEYKALVEKSLGSLATGNIFGLGMSIYMGVEAENARAERKRQNKEQESDIQSLSSKNITLGSLKRVEHDLQNCRLAAIDAEVATNNLRHVWNVIDKYVKKSVEKMSEINDGLELYKFMSTFQLVVESWIKVETDADLLVQVFADADKDYQEEARGPRVKRSIVNSPLVINDYPALDLATLSNAKKQMRGDRAKAKVLSEQLNYLPDLNSRFDRLVGNVYDRARDLQESADSSKRQIEDAKTEIAQLKKNLAREISRGTDKNIIEKINVDRTKVLTTTRKVIEGQKSVIDDGYKSIADYFDTKQTSDFLSRLQVDIENTNARKAALEVTLAGYRADQKIIDDAIRAIESAGVEKIGKDVNLTVDKLKSLSMAMPQAELVKLAVEQLQKTIESITKDVSFLFMLEESRSLQKKATVTQAKIAEQQAIIEASDKKIQFIKVIHAMDEQHRLFVSEYKKATDAFSRFSSAISSGDAEIPEEEFLTEANSFLEFLDPVSIPAT